MIRTQIQLPDKLYRRLKELAKSEETSLAEIMRRAGEHILLVHPEYELAQKNWQPPEPEDLGEFQSHESNWRILANAQEFEDIASKEDSGS